MNGIPCTGTKGTIFTPVGEGATRIQTKPFQSSKYASTELGSTTERHSGSNSTPLRDSSEVEHILGRDETRVRLPFLDPYYAALAQLVRVSP